MTTKYLLYAPPKARLMPCKRMLDQSRVHSFESFCSLQVSKKFQQSSVHTFNIWKRLRALQKRTAEVRKSGKSPELKFRVTSGKPLTRHYVFMNDSTEKCFQNLLILIKAASSSYLDSSELLLLQDYFTLKCQCTLAHPIKISSTQI